MGGRNLSNQGVIVYESVFFSNQGFEFPNQVFGLPHQSPNLGWVGGWVGGGVSSCIPNQGS